MTVVLVLGAIAVVAAVLIRAMWRSSADERHSVRDYHQTLETLRNLSDRNTPRDRQRPQARPETTPVGRSEATPGARSEPTPAARPETTPVGRSQAKTPVRSEALPKTRDRGTGRTLLGRSSSTSDSWPTRQQEVASGQVVQGAGPAAEPSQGAAASAASTEPSEVLAEPEAPVRSGAADGGKRPDLVFDDNAAAPMARSGGVSAFKMSTGEAAYSSGGVGRRRISRWSVTPPTSGRGGLFAVAVVVVLVALVAALVTLGISSSGGKHPSSTAHAATHGSSSTSSHGSSGGRSSGQGSTKKGSTNKKSKGSTSTTAPATLKPTTSSAAEAAYAAPASGYTVALSASGPCWVEAEEVATGAVVYTGTLSAGESQQISATGDLFVRLGAAFVVTVSLNGEPIALPEGHQSPFNVTFQAA
jgi:Domain of unknown function (DUF4115)